MPFIVALSTANTYPLLIINDILHYRLILPTIHRIAFDSPSFIYIYLAFFGALEFICIVSITAHIPALLTPVLSCFTFPTCKSPTNQQKALKGGKATKTKARLKSECIKSRLEFSFGRYISYFSAFRLVRSQKVGKSRQVFADALEWGASELKSTSRKKCFSRRKNPKKPIKLIGKF